MDPTGAGNAFLGAFTYTYMTTCDLFESACCGVVASSFTIEQIGLPILGTGEDGVESCNGLPFSKRLQEYKNRLETVH